MVTITVPTLVLVLPVLALMIWAYAWTCKRYVLDPLNQHFERRMANLREALEECDGE